MRMLKWMCEHIKSDRIKNENIKLNESGFRNGLDATREIVIVWIHDEKIVPMP